MNNLKLFALGSTKEFGQDIADCLNIKVSNHEEKTFDDGELYCASLENVRGADVFVVHSLYSDAEESINDKLMKMFVFIGSLKDASANRITSVLPIFPYARQDRKTSSRAPITTKYVAQMFESLGINRILTIDAHNPTALQNAFKINVDLLEAAGLFAKHVASRIKKITAPIAVMSDVGGLTRVRKFRKALSKCLSVEEDLIGIACIDKLHANSGEITADKIIGDVKNKKIIIVDDMISSGKTIYECAKASMAAGAVNIEFVCATHGLFVGKANKYLEHPFINNIVTADTIENFRINNPKIKEKLTTLKTAELFAEAILRTHKSESISDLIENGYLEISA